LGLPGAAAGMAAGVVVIEVFNKQGIDLTAYAQKGMEAWGYSAVLYPSLSWNFYLVVAFLVIFTGIAASAYPAWKALKLNPADALRTE